MKNSIVGQAPQILHWLCRSRKFVKYIIWIRNPQGRDKIKSAKSWGEAWPFNFWLRRSYMPLLSAAKIGPRSKSRHPEPCEEFWLSDQQEWKCIPSRQNNKMQNSFSPPPPPIYLESFQVILIWPDGPESVVWFIEDQTFSPGLAPPLSPPPFLSVSSIGDTQEDWERDATCWREGGEGVGEEPFSGTDPLRYSITVKFLMI